MPIDPTNINMTGYGQSILGGAKQRPSETNLLMAAADMHGMGRLTEEPQRSMPQGQERPRVNLKRKSNRPLKVVK